MHSSYRLAGHLARGLLLVAASLIAACGGGGGGGPSLSITLSPASVSASYYHGSSYSFNETATVQGEVSGTVYVVLVDHAAVLQPTLSLQSEGDGRFVAALATAPTLAVGHYTGTIQVNLCDSLSCTHQYGSTSLPYDFTVLPGPSVATLSPASVNAGGSAFTLTVDGANFNNSSQVVWNGNTRPTSFVSSTRLTAQISNADILTGGVYNISVANGPDSGGNSDSVGFTVLNLKPTLASLSPNSIAPGTANAFIVTATGTNFVNTSVLQWGGSPRPTTYISPTQVSAQIEAADVASGGNINVTVANPAPGGGTSGAVVFAVKNPVPVLGALNNGSAAAGCGAFNLYLIGNDFAPQSVVMWNGSPRPTTFSSTSVLSAQIGAADLASAGTASVTVFSAAPGGGTSAAVTFTTSAAATPTTDAVALQLNASHSGYATTTCPVSLPAASSWSFTFPDTPLYALIAGDKVFATTFGSSGSSLYALDQKTGKTDWGPVTASGTGTAYDAGALFVVGNGVCCSAGLMQAFNAADGTQKWLANLTGQYVFDSGATALNGLVYTSAAGSGGTLYAVNESNGNTVWTDSLINGDASTPAVDANGVYTAFPCQTEGDKPGDGSVLWHDAEGCDGGGGGTPVLANGVLYAPNGFGTYNGTRFNALTGANLGSYNADNMPAVTPSYGIFVIGGTVQAVKLPGNTLAWSFGAPGGINTSPIVVNQTVFVGAQSGTLYALDAASGQILWSHDFGTSLYPGAGWSATNTSALAAGDNLLLVPAGNTLTAFPIASPLAPR